MYAIPSATTALPTLVPGPFLLLLLLPAIPLLLFSVGARPPDTSSLPFTTNDLWRTSVFVTVAGAIVLCLGVYPDVATEMGRWVVNGGSYGTVVKPLAQARHGHSKLAMPGVTRGWAGVQDARRPMVAVGGPMGRGRLPTHLGFPTPPFIADHLFHLRNGIFANWYNPTTMSLLTTLLLSCVIALVLIVLVGKLVGAGYDNDIGMRASSSSSSSSSTSTSSSSSSSPPLPFFIRREIAKRKIEKPEETLTRVQAEKRIAVLDSKTRATLVEHLEREGLNLAGLDDSKGDETKDDESKTSDEAKPAKTLQRLQRKLLGKGLYNGLQRKKQETAAAGGTTTEHASLRTPGHVVEVTAQAQNTTDMANKLRVDMAST